VEWQIWNVADPEGKALAISYKIRYVPTTIINGTKRLVGVTTIEQLKEEIAKNE
jgi:protein-disulfide isomerase